MQGAIKHVKAWLAAVGSTAMATLTWFELRPRPAQLAMVVMTVAGFTLALDGMSGWQVWHQLFYPDTSNVGKVRFWSALVYNLLLALGLPVAFLIWHWRDKNVRDQIEQQRLQVDNARKDTNLKEFLEVQGRAVGLFDEKMPASAREQLQIAALHQLRGFLRGEYGDAFRRPAFELIFAGHAEAMDRIGMIEARQKIQNDDLDYYEILRIGTEKRRQFDRIIRERLGIMRDEISSIIGSGFPLEGRNWDFCNLEGVQFPRSVSLTSGSFMFTRLASAVLDCSDMTNADFEGANLFRSSLKDVVLQNTNLRGATLAKADLANSKLRWSNLIAADAHQANFTAADLQGVRLDSADLSACNFEGANLTRARFFGARLYEAKFDKAKLQHAMYDDTTEFFSRYDDYTFEQLEAARDSFRERGAVQGDGSDDVPF